MCLGVRVLSLGTNGVFSIDPSIPATLNPYNRSLSSGGSSGGEGALLAMKGAQRLVMLVNSEVIDDSAGSPLGVGTGGHMICY